MSAGTPDRDLIAAVAQRDDSALSALYDRYSAVLFPLCLRLVRDRHDAEELLADVFFEVWSQPARYDPGRGSVLTYLTTLTRSRGIDRLRSGRKRRMTIVAAEDPEELGGRAARSDPEPSPFQSALLADQRAHVQKALEALDDRQRLAIEMAFYEGLTHTEISEHLGEPLGTIKGRIRHGLIQLRDSLRSLHEGGGAA